MLLRPFLRPGRAEAKVRFYSPSPRAVQLAAAPPASKTGLQEWRLPLTACTQNALFPILSNARPESLSWQTDHFKYENGSRKAFLANRWVAAGEEHHPLAGRRRPHHNWLVSEARLDHAGSDKRLLQKRVCFECFAYVCPEPVLVKRSHLYL